MSDELATFVDRRQRFAEALGDGIAVIPGAQETARNGDVHHEFRQASDFFFLTGFDEPDAVAVLRPGSDAPYDWSPGAPLFYAGIYYLTGGVHPGLGRLAIALLGLVTIVICYLLGRRLSGAAGGLVAALLAATYPAFVFNTGRLLSEPLAEVLVPGAVLAFLWALERRSLWAWLAPGVLIGASALARPEYLLFGIALGRAGWEGLTATLTAALLLEQMIAAVAGAWVGHRIALRGATDIEEA